MADLLAAAVLVLIAAVALNLWPHPEGRTEKLLVAICGALVGSLIGRVLANPGWFGHAIFLAGGALVFSFLDWVRRRRPAEPREQNMRP